MESGGKSWIEEGPPETGKSQGMKTTLGGDPGWEGTLVLARVRDEKGLLREGRGVPGTRDGLFRERKGSH